MPKSESADRFSFDSSNYAANATLFLAVIFKVWVLPWSQPRMATISSKSPSKPGQALVSICKYNMQKKRKIFLFLQNLIGRGFGESVEDCSLENHSYKTENKQFLTFGEKRHKTQKNAPSSIGWG